MSKVRIWFIHIVINSFNPKNHSCLSTFIFPYNFKTCNSLLSISHRKPRATVHGFNGPFDSTTKSFHFDELKWTNDLNVLSCRSSSLEPCDNPIRVRTVFNWSINCPIVIEIWTKKWSNSNHFLQVKFNHQLPEPFKIHFISDSLGLLGLLLVNCC